MKPALKKMIILLFMSVVLSACSTTGTSTSQDEKAPSLAEKINIRRDRF